MKHHQLADARYAWAVVALLWVVAALNYVDRQVIFSLFPLLQVQLDLSNVKLGLLGAAFLWTYGIVSPFGGYLADRFKRSIIILISFAVWTTVTLMIGFASNYIQLLAAQAVMGISEACYLPAALALIADYHGEATRSRAVGLHQSGLYAGIAFGGWIGGWIGQRYGWQPVFYTLGSFGLVYLLVLFLGLRDAQRRPVFDCREHPVLLKSAVRRLATEPAFLILLAANCFASTTFWCVYAWLATLIFDRFKMSLAVAGFTSTVYIQAASFIGILGGGWLSDVWARNSRRGRVWMQTIGFFVAAPALFLVATAASWRMLALYLVCFGLGKALYDCNLMPVLCEVVPNELRATAYGLLNSSSCICGGIMVGLVGIIRSHLSLGAAVQIASACLLVSAACLMVLKLTPQRVHIDITREPAL